MSSLSVLKKRRSLDSPIRSRGSDAQTSRSLQLEHQSERPPFSSFFILISARCVTPLGHSSNAEASTQPPQAEVTLDGLNTASRPTLLPSTSRRPGSPCCFRRKPTNRCSALLCKTLLQALPIDSPVEAPE